MALNAKKTKVMVISRVKEANKIEIKVDGVELEQVDQFLYLGSIINEEGRCNAEIKKRIGIAKSAFLNCKEFLRRDIALNLKRRLLDCYVKSVLSYGCETWTYSEDSIRRILAFQMWCYRRMLKVKYLDHVCNKKVKEIMGTENVNWVEDLQKRKLKFAGHLLRGSGGTLMQLVLEGRVDGSRMRGRPRRTWGLDIKDWAKAKHLGEVKRRAED